MPSKERNYTKELENEKARGSQMYGFKLKKDDAILYNAILDKFSCKSCGEFARKIAHGELVVSERD